MMFKKQPRPPHCDNLTDAQVKILRKMIKTEWDYTLWKRTEKLVAQGWGDVLVAFAQQSKTRQAQLDWVFIALYNDPSPEKDSVHLQLLPAIKAFDAAFRGQMLAAFLTRVKDQPALMRQAIDCMPDARAKGEALRSLADTADLASVMAPIDLLMDENLDLHFEKAALIKLCLMREHYSLADRILIKGFDLPLYSQDLVKFALESDLPHGAHQYLDYILRNAGLDEKPAPRQIELAAESDYVRTGDSVSRIDALPDGSTISTVFNFASGQQLIIARAGAQISTPAVINFSTIEERQQLEAAAKAYIAQGGNADLAARCVTLPKRVIAAKPEAKS